MNNKDRNVINQRYKKTENGLISNIYSAQKTRSKGRGHEMPSYSVGELKEWLYENNFKDLYNNWVESGYKRSLRPSVDRLNNYRPYKIDNIRLVTAYENISKENTKLGKAVAQIKDGKEITIFKSQRKASKETGVNQALISQVCNGIFKQAGGYQWEFRKDYFKKLYDI